ncbi:MAG: enoyl-CoA hydratase [Anaerolinea sp.]|nr:enoyl-CoA hydratase [Anaerolinea sp.]
MRRIQRLVRRSCACHSTRPTTSRRPAVGYDQILTETRGRVGIIRLNRPEKLNAWTAQMGEQVRDQVAKWNGDDAIGAILITGEGRAFCAGADLGSFATRVQANSAGPGEVLQRGGVSFTHFLRESKPTVAAINGYAVGVGLTMILPCDIRIASSSAKLSIRFVKMGLMPELGSTRLLAQLVGLGNATDMCLTGRMVDADEALRMGLVTEVVPPESLFTVAMAKAEEIANNPARAVRMIKELLAKNPLDPDLEAVMERENLRDQIARRLPDHAEAVAAFLEKRDPHFNR